MKISLYCDTCIYQDWFEWRPGKKWLHYGEEAKRLLDRVKNGEFALVISNHLEFQLSKFPEFQEYLKEVGSSVIRVVATAADKQLASMHAETHPTSEFEDALHAELAIRGGASVLVTDNLEHFGSYEGRIKIRRPEHVGLF